MEKNVGKIDSIIRYVLGAVFIAVGYWYHWAFYILAAIMIITSITGFCVLYKLFDIDTN